MWESGKFDATGRRLFVSLWTRRRWRGKLDFIYLFYLSVIAVSRGLSIQIIAPDLWRDTSPRSSYHFRRAAIILLFTFYYYCLFSFTFYFTFLLFDPIEEPW